jgi:hypothetical protein
MEKPTLLVLAAGMGSRYGGLKQIDPMGPAGETILDYSIYDAIRGGFAKVVFVIRKEFEESFRDSVGNRFMDRIEVDYAFQELEDIPVGFEVPGERRKPWGTAHAVYSARNEISSPFGVINADDFYGRDAYVQASDFLSGSGAALPESYCLVGYRLGNTLSDHGGVNRGVTTRTDGGLLRNVEEVTGITRGNEGTVRGVSIDGSQRELSEDTLVSMNFWGFSPLLFTQLEANLRGFLESCSDTASEEWHIPTVIGSLLRQGEASCKVISSEGRWFGVTHREDKPIVMETIRKLVESGVYPCPLWE